MSNILIYSLLILGVFLQDIRYWYIALAYRLVDIVETLYLEMNGIVTIVTRLTLKMATFADLRKNILKRSGDCLLYTKKATSCVLFVR